MWLKNVRMLMLLDRVMMCFLCDVDVQQPSAVWSPLYLSLVDNLVNRNGILSFFHDHLRQAVEHKYLPSDDDKLRAFTKLANFFDSRVIDDRKVRAA